MQKNQNKKQILITGGCGFVGSNIAISLKKKYPDYTIYAFDNLKRRGSELSIARLKENNIYYIHGDIRNVEDFRQINNIDCIIDAAAEPSVLSGINSSLDFLIHTNFNGTVNALNFAVENNADFIFLSTSRIYPIEQINKINVIEEKSRFSISDKQVLNGVSSHGITEDFPLTGARSFYGATKLASELMVTEYNRFKGIKTVINRCGVIAGPWQMGKIDQGFVTLWVAAHLWKRNLSYIGFGGEGKQVRDVLYIDDLLELIDKQINEIDKINGMTFNVGGGIKVNTSLQELTKICQDVTGNQIAIGKIKETRNTDIKLYITDHRKLSNIFDWLPKTDLIDIVDNIYEWLKSNEKQYISIIG